MKKLHKKLAVTALCLASCFPTFAQVHFGGAGGYSQNHTFILGESIASPQKLGVLSSIQTDRIMQTHAVEMWADTTQTVINVVTTNKIKVSSLDVVGSFMFEVIIPANVEIVEVRSLLASLGVNTIPLPDGTTLIIGVWFATQNSLSFTNTPVVELDLKPLTGTQSDCFDISVENPFASGDDLIPIADISARKGLVCIQNEYRIMGNVITDEDLGVNNVRLNNDGNLVFTTSIDGNFDFVMRHGEALDLSFSKDKFDEYPSYIYSNDLQKIQFYLIRRINLNAYEKVISDCDGDNRTTSNDLLSLQRLLLRRITTFPNNVPTWKFTTDLDINELDPFSPLFSSTLSIASVEANADLSGRIRALPTGDVAPVRVSRQKKRPVSISVQEEILADGTKKIKYVANEDIEFLAFQLSAKTTTKSLEVISDLDDENGYSFEGDNFLFAPINYQAKTFMISKGVSLFEVITEKDAVFEINNTIPFKIVSTSFDLIDVKIEKENAIEEEFLIYPNPASTEFQILAKESGDLIIFNAQGSEITKYPVSVGKNTIPINLSQGIYLIRLGRLSQKLIVE
jgi:hypothetical protein